MGESVLKLSRANDRVFRQLQSAETGELYSKSSVLSEVLEFRGAFFSLERVALGVRASRRHHHLEQDEAVFILNGKVRVECGERIEILEAGDACVFSAGNEDHTVVGDSTPEAQFLLIRSEKRT